MEPADGHSGDQHADAVPATPNQHANDSQPDTDGYCDTQPDDLYPGDAYQPTSTVLQPDTAWDAHGDFNCDVNFTAWNGISVGYDYSVAKPDAVAICNRDNAPEPDTYSAARTDRNSADAIPDGNAHTHSQPNRCSYQHKYARLQRVSDQHCYTLT